MLDMLSVYFVVMFYQTVSNHKVFLIYYNEVQCHTTNVSLRLTE